MFFAIGMTQTIWPSTRGDLPMGALQENTLDVENI